MLSRDHKLSKESLKAVAFKSTAISGPYFLARIQFGSAESRFAVVVSKKVSPLAVVRNRERRKVYLALAELLPSLSVPTSGIFTLSKGVLGATPEALKAEVARVVRITSR